MSRVLSDVKVASVSNASTLYPTYGGLAFKVPALVGVVSHLVRLVLPEPHLVLVNVVGLGKQVDSADVVGQSFALNDFLLKRNHSQTVQIKNHLTVVTVSNRVSPGQLPI